MFLGALKLQVKSASMEAGMDFLSSSFPSETVPSFLELMPAPAKVNLPATAFCCPHLPGQAADASGTTALMLMEGQIEGRVILCQSYVEQLTVLSDVISRTSL